MIWHIFKKDARLLWWLAAGVAALEFAKIGILLNMGLFPQNPRLYLLSQLLSMGGVLAVGFTIAAVVHQDAIPGVRQDWLVRPIRRRDLLLAKLLFVVALVQLPILAANVVEAVASGFPLGVSLAAASSRSVYLLLLVDIPFLAFAVLTKNLLEAITGGVAIFFAVATLLALVTGPGNRFLRQPTLGTGMEWITVSALVLVLALGSVTLLALQYFRRRTFLARCLTGGVTILAVLTTFLPWQPAFAIERSLSTAPGAAQAVGLTFSPGLGKLQLDATIPRPDMRGDAVPLFLPVRISGLPEGAGLQADRVEIRATEANGQIDAIETPTGALSALHERSGNPEQNVYQILAVAGELYARIKHQPVRLEVDYALTLFQFAGAHALPAVNGAQYIPNVGWCQTRINNTETAVQFRCQQAGRKPGCEMFLLEHTPSGRRNPARFGCGENADYAPYLAWQFMPDSMWRFGGTLPFRVAAGLGRYPVDGSMLPESQAVLRVYEPVDHFARRLVIPQVRLADWEAGTAGP